MNILSSDGLRSLVTSRPGSACSLSRDGEGLSDLDAVFVGRGKREASRGIPLGRVGVFGCVSIVAFLWLHASGGGGEVVGFSKLRRGNKIRERRPWGAFRSQQRMKWRKTTMCPR